MIIRHLAPLSLFLALAGLLGTQLGKEPAPLPSALLNRPAPAFKAAQLDESMQAFEPGALKGKVWLLNVWASWCVSCQAEHSVLLDLGRQQPGLPLVGLNYEDDARQGRAWLQAHGNPYRWTAQDKDGRIGMEFGVYGVPETFVIDKQGRIRLRHAGPMTQEVLEGTVLPLLKELEHG